MARRRKQESTLPAPYLKRVWLDADRIDGPKTYPFVLPFLKDGFELEFEHRITIIAGENGVGKSTLLEGLAALAGFGMQGGNRDHARPHGDTSLPLDGDALAVALRAAWLPKVTYGWFFRAESFFSIARYLDDAGGGAGPDFLSYSHGEGFMRFFEERCNRPGVYIFDEPESALSPSRQVEFLKLLRMMHLSEKCQVIMATHSPMLMALPEAELLRMGKYGLEPTLLEDTDHFRMWREFCISPANFVDSMLDD
ncbi:MAG: AAA family ATPase [Hyphomicrobiaceae bacterium]